MRAEYARTGRTESGLYCRMPAEYRSLDPSLIVATVELHGMTILTPDPLIAAYPGVQTAW